MFLEGLPNLQQLAKLRIGEHAAEMLQCDLDLGTEQILALRDAITLCESEKDYISRELLEKRLTAEEDHIDWIESQQFIISNAGIENYLQSMMEES